VGGSWLSGQHQFKDCLRISNLAPMKPKRLGPNPVDLVLLLLEPWGQRRELEQQVVSSAQSPLVLWLVHISPSFIDIQISPHLTVLRWAGFPFPLFNLPALTQSSFSLPHIQIRMSELGTDLNQTPVFGLSFPLGMDWMVFSKIHVHQGPQNVTLFKNRLFAGTIKLRWDHSVFGAGSTSSDWHT
jgi:hypothetical protein